ncbi:SSI family serine proteinase inhibitor [Umezawaea beigongshangensis]|uniref:SSI family serine proteinase inhibitor n=1 Tax=Umezawaea beigongshangensis TaxID=2780383 RepID=UPI0018F1DACD|nr:SSI family serine proteinase inhibitor [Umezawaea beigongshangensis]
MARTRLLATSVLTCLAVVAPLPAAAAASSASAPPLFLSALVLSAQDEVGGLRTTELRCEPTGGRHPHAELACADLVTARGDFAALPGDPALEFCTMELRPVTVSAHGTWRGVPVTHSKTYSNPCLSRRATGPVFTF